MITKDDSEMYRCLNRFSPAVPCMKCMKNSVEKMHVDVGA